MNATKNDMLLDNIAVDFIYEYRFFKETNFNTEFTYCIESTDIDKNLLLAKIKRNLDSNTQDISIRQHKNMLFVLAITRYTL